MAELITWNTCKLAFAQQYFVHHYEGLFIIYMASLLFLLYLLLNTTLMKTQLQSSPIWTKHGERTLRFLLLGGVFLTLLFTLYVIFIFKPDMTQAVVNQMANYTFYGVESHV